MLIKRFMVAVLLLMALCIQSQAQNSPLGGEWVLEKVEVKIYAQSDDRLLEEKTVTSPDQFSTINAFIPTGLLFRGDDYQLSSGNSLKSGRYTVAADNMLMLWEPEEQPSPQPAVPAFTLKYTLPETSRLTLQMPAANYKDNVRNLAVKLLSTCYYRKKSL